MSGNAEYSENLELLEPDLGAMVGDAASRVGRLRNTADDNEG